MVTPLLETKFYVPRWRRGLVPRPRLSDRLNRGAESKLTLVSAPAGFGKTTLLADWLAAVAVDGRTVTWLSLDQSDNHPASFWTYLIAALQTAESHIGASAISLLQSPQPPSIEAILTLLLNELSAMSMDVMLVLDDYHVIDARDIHDGMVFLLDHLPPRLHLVIASRTDPPLPLARLRARGELVEIRAEDLRFAPDEVASYFRESMGLDLTARDVAVLEGRTEGWIAALQLAALSMQGRSDVTGFIASFAGDDRYIVDYLVEEVLQRQPETVRTFLRDTSILERLSGSLCDAVTGHDGGKAMLEALERANLFVVPLDDRRRWYRYHHLFADVLRARLLDEYPDDVPELHRRASAWYERNGEASEAIRHALAAGDFPKAADLIELAAPALRRNRQEAALLGWLAAMPEELLRCRPVLSNVFAGELLAAGKLEDADARLRDAERWVEPRGADRPEGLSAGMVVVDEARFRRLPGAVAVHRAGHALLLGNLALTEQHARRALDLAPDDDHLGRGSAAALLGLAGWASGHLESAHQSYAAGAASLRRAGHHADALGCTVALADIRIAQGRLREAMRTHEQALQLAAEQGPPVLRGTADMHVGMSRIHCERNDLHAAMQHLLTSQQLGEHTGLPQNPYRWRVAMARLVEARGDLDGAHDLLQDAERLYVGDFFPNVRPVSAVKARVWVAQGKLDEALAWALGRGLSVADDLSYLREFEHITLARVLLARQATSDALGLLERLLHAADDGARTGSVIEILALQALTHQVRGEIPAALEPLERALTLAEPEGYARIFVDEGPAMAALLQVAAKRRTAPEYVRQLLAAFGKPQTTTPVTKGLMEPLSGRELDVLRLLRTDLDGPDIARQLVVSLSTLRTHTRSIYNKLGVNNRRAAVRRAEELLQK
ncbi:MAG TPA: LuxR C-terminal-related transcriptional regulator [Ktedonobacterales bacterium]|nr:LuxR C-terminal-related transcriptional regulator [Ktedonobacterales bacterium]